MFKRIFFGWMLCIGLVYASEMFQSVPSSKALLVQHGEAKQQCPNCGMDLVKFYKTSHIHENHHYCSIHCLVEATKGIAPHDAKVVDTHTLEHIAAKSAFYVVGSTKPGTMTMKSQYAFGNEADAKAFQTQNGGEIVGFERAYALSKEDFEDDTPLLKEKRNQDMYDRGEKLYKNGCEKINVSRFGTVSELKASLNESCRLQTEEQAQMVAFFLWEHKAAPTSVSEEKIIVPKDAKCPICGMFVAKYPQWVAVIEDGEKNLYFDGVKDMMKYLFSQKKKFEKIYVSDYYKLKKIDAREAFYVMGANVYGPMGSELIPFVSENEAVTFMKDHNGKRVLRFSEIDEKSVKNL